MGPLKRIVKNFDISQRDRSLSSSPSSATVFKKSESKFVNLSSTRNLVQKSEDFNSTTMTVGISDEHLINMDIKDLNDYLRRFDKEKANELRKRRRLLKNRGYAQSTRTKRVTTIESALQRKVELQKELMALKRQTKGMEQTLDRIRTENQRAGLSSIVKVEPPSTGNVYVGLKTQEDVKDWDINF